MTLIGPRRLRGITRGLSLQPLDLLVLEGTRRMTLQRQLTGKMTRATPDGQRDGRASQYSRSLRLRDSGARSP